MRRHARWGDRRHGQRAFDGPDRKRLLSWAATDMQLSFEVDPSAPISLQYQRVGQISTSITIGRLKPGTRLPGTRALSERLGVSRNTVLLGPMPDLPPRASSRRAKAPAPMSARQRLSRPRRSGH